MDNTFCAAEGNNNEGKEEWKEAAASHLQKCGLTSEQIEYCLNLSMGVESLTENMWVNDAGIRSERIYDSISNSAVGTFIFCHRYCTLSFKCVGRINNRCRHDHQSRREFRGE